MSDPTPKRFGSPRRHLPPWLATGDVHEWTKTVALVAAALWGVYTFIWKDILVPSWAPASLVIEVKPRKEALEDRQVERGKVPARLRWRVIATNPSARTLYLLPNVWWVSRVEDQQNQLPPISFEDRANEVLRRRSERQAERDRAEESYEVLATGGLFIDDQILPGETLSRDLSITLPKDNTKVVLQLIVPALTRNPQHTSGAPVLFSGQYLAWAYSDTYNSMGAVLCKNANFAANDSPCAPVPIQQEIQRFDPGSMVFSRTVILND